MDLYYRGGDFISIKVDQILKYIENLPEGKKISVRELAADMSVSEGTAYKAVKAAEQEGLVIVRPKSGTFRAPTSHTPVDEAMPITELISLLGLRVVAGKENRNRKVRSLLIADGDAYAITCQIQESGDPASCLVLCGHRPYIQNAAAELGANLLLTSGVEASTELLAKAELRGETILASPQSALTIVQILDRARGAERMDPSETDRVLPWMQPTERLYYNDILADWQRIYRESCFIQQYPVVDEDLTLVGGLDLWQAASAMPSQKVRTALSGQMAIPCVSGKEQVSELAKRFVLGNESLAAVVDNDKVEGIITANDLLRYYMYKEPNQQTDLLMRSVSAFPVRDNLVSDQNTAVYHVKLSNNERDQHQNAELKLMFSAVRDHLKHNGINHYRVESGTLFALRSIAGSDNALLTCHLQKETQNHLMAEVELNDERVTCARMIVLINADNREEADHVFEP